MKKAMIYAYTAGNLGDDLFIQILCSRYPKVDFFLYAPKNYERIFTHLTNLNIIPNDRFIQKIIHRMRQPFLYRDRIAKSCDVSIYIGGSIFAERPEWKSDRKNVESMLNQGHPLFILGANFGPYESKEFLEMYEHLFRDCTDVCFRDYASYDLFPKLPNVRHASDIVFQLPMERNWRVQSKQTIIISVIYPSIRPHLASFDESYFQALKNIAIHCIENGYEITFMSFCELEKDPQAIKQIMALIPDKYKKHIKTYFYETNIEDTLEKIASATAIIATRFHAMILGWVYEKPVFPIIYSEKMRTVIEDCQFPGDYSDLKDVQLKEPEQIIRALQMEPFQIATYRKNSLRQFALLDDLLNNDVI